MANLFERRPLSGGDLAGAIPRDPEDAATQVAVDIEIVAPSVDALSTVHERANVSMEPAPDIADLRKLVSAIDAISVSSSPHDQVDTLSQIYREQVVPAWGAQLDIREFRLREIAAERAELRRPVNEQFERETAALAAQSESEAKACAAKVQVLRKEFDDFVVSSSQLARDIWRRVGDALDLSEPFFGSPSEYSGADALQAGEYDVCAAQAQQLPQMSGLTKDKAFGRGVPWAVGIGLIFGGSAFGSVQGALLTALWAVAGMAIWAYWRHSHAKELFERLVDLTPIEQCRRLGVLNGCIAELENDAAAAESARDARRRDAQSTRDMRFAGIDEDLAGPIAGELCAWNNASDGFQLLLDNWTQALNLG